MAGSTRRTEFFGSYRERLYSFLCAAGSITPWPAALFCPGDPA